MSLKKAIHKINPELKSSPVCILENLQVLYNSQYRGGSSNLDWKKRVGWGGGGALLSRSYRISQLEVFSEIYEHMLFEKLRTLCLYENMK